MEIINVPVKVGGVVVGKAVISDDKIVADIILTLEVQTALYRVFKSGFCYELSIDPIFSSAVENKVLLSPTQEVVTNGN